MASRMLTSLLPPTTQQRLATDKSIIGDAESEAKRLQHLEHVAARAAAAGKGDDGALGEEVAKIVPTMAMAAGYANTTPMPSRPRTLA